MCPRPRAHFPHTIQSLIPSMKNKRQFSRWNSSILALKCAAVSTYQLFGNKLAGLSMLASQLAWVITSVFQCSVHIVHCVCGWVCVCVWGTPTGFYISSILASLATLTSILLLPPCSQMINPLLKCAFQKRSGRQILTLKFAQLRFGQRGNAIRDVLNTLSSVHLYSSVCWQTHAGTHTVNLLADS